MIELKMSFLMEDFEEEESYIFLDQDGKASKKYNFYVKCSAISQQEIIVTCKADSSLHFLNNLIVDSLQQKIEAFSGLNSLKVVNLSKKGGLIPSNGIVKKILRSSEMLTCDIATPEIWLDVSILRPGSRRKIEFQVKAHKNILLKALKKPILAIARESGFVYNAEDLAIITPRSLSATVGDLFTIENNKVGLEICMLSEDLSDESPNDDPLLEQISEHPRTLTYRKLRTYSNAQSMVSDEEEYCKSKLCVCEIL